MGSPRNLQGESMHSALDTKDGRRWAYGVVNASARRSARRSIRQRPQRPEAVPTDPLTSRSDSPPSPLFQFPCLRPEGIYLFYPHQRAFSHRPCLTQGTATIAPSFLFTCPSFSLAVSPPSPFLSSPHRSPLTAHLALSSLLSPFSA